MNTCEITIIIIVIAAFASVHKTLNDLSSQMAFNITTLSTDITSLSSNITTLSTNITTLSTNITTLSSNITTLSDNLEKLRSETNEGFTTARTNYDTSLENLRSVLMFDKAKLNAMKSSVRIRVIFGKKFTTGCGNILSIDGDLYISTARHLMFMEEKIGENVTIKLIESGVDYYITGYEIISNKEMDLALIKLKDRILEERSVQLSDRDLFIGSRIIGFSDLPSGLVFLTGSIIKFSANFVQVNTGGYEGFSGTGYFDPDGHLIGIHVGNGNIDEFSELSRKTKKSLQKMIKYVQNLAKINKTITKMKVGDSESYEEKKKLKEEIELNFQNINHYITVNSRNPRTLMAESKYLKEIIKK